jgi:hypothetical protein
VSRVRREIAVAYAGVLRALDLPGDQDHGVLAARAAAASDHGELGAPVAAALSGLARRVTLAPGLGVSDAAIDVVRACARGSKEGLRAADVERVLDAGRACVVFVAEREGEMGSGEVGSGEVAGKGGGDGA